MLPALDRLSLLRTGEFYALSKPELDEFTAEEKVDPITLESFERDAGGWRTFRVRNETPRADGTYKYHYYKASALWQHYDSQTPKKDPLTNQPIWYEDWMALHDAYDAFPNATGFIPRWVYSLPTRDPGTVKAQPPPVSPTPQPEPANQLPIRNIPMSPTPIRVHRQPNRPQLTEAQQESERYHAANNRANERFDRLLRADDANTVDALVRAQSDADEADAAIQRMLQRHQSTGDASAAEVSNHQWLMDLAARRRQRLVAEARERWSERMETFASDLDLVNELNRRRQDWTRLAASANPTRESLEQLNRSISRLEAQLIEVFDNRLQSMTRDDQRSEATQAATERAFEEIGAERLRRTTMIAWLLDPRSPPGPRPVRQNAMPLSEEDVQERERMFQAFEERERLRREQQEPDTPMVPSETWPQEE